MPSRLRVRNEGMPARCEICHQADALNSVGKCSRCHNLVIPEALLQDYDKEDRGFAFPFGRLPATKFVSVLISLIFTAQLLGFWPTLLLGNLIATTMGIKRVLNNESYIGIPVIDLLINLTLMSGGIVGCGFGGLYLIEFIKRLSH